MTLTGRPTRFPLLSLAPALALALAAGPLAGCAPAPSTPAPVVTGPPPVMASFPCDGVSLPVPRAVCSNQSLATLDVAMAAALHRHLGDDDMVQRDQVLASQRDWLLQLGQACHVQTPADPGSIACLSQQYQDRTAALAQWQTLEVPWQPAPLANYVTYTLIDAKDPALCASLVAAAPAALAPGGALDPARLAGVQEVAGSHGPASGTDAAGAAVAVATGRSGLYAGYQQRATTVSIAGQPVLDPTALGGYASSTPNDAGRFGTYASQTGDYGSIDVVTRDRRALALVTDTIGFYSPATGGEAALAAVFTLGQGTATPACLFRTYLKPPYDGTFREQPSLGRLLTLLDSIHGAAPDALPGDAREETTQFADQTRWQLFNMPLVESAEVQHAGWTGWLRHRHDQVLDALFAWSQKSPQAKAEFDQLFTLLRPAAQELAQIYQQQQGMSQSEAVPATSLAMLELLYQSIGYLAPGVGAGPADPGAYARYRPRYPILASPGG